MRTCAAILCLCLSTPASWAQTTAPDPKAAMDQAAKILNGANASAQAESTLRAAGQSANAGVAERLAAQGEKDAVVQDNPAEKQMTQDADKRMQHALDNASPEAKALLAQQEPAIPVARAPVAPAEAATPVERTPGAIAAAEGEAPPGQTKTVITCQGSAYFDSKQSFGVFVEDVVVVHPQFVIHCEELEVYMVKDKPKPAAAVDAGGRPTVAAEAPAAEKDKQEGSIDRAIAKGKRVVIEKLDEHGEPQIGICRHCTYLGSNGDTYLRDKPQVQRGNNLIRATSPATYMIITQDGKLHTYGPTTTDIIQKKKGPDPAAAPAPGAVPATTAPAPKATPIAPKPNKP